MNTTWLYRMKSSVETQCFKIPASTNQLPEDVLVATVHINTRTVTMVELSDRQDIGFKNVRYLYVTSFSYKTLQPMCTLCNIPEEVMLTALSTKLSRALPPPNTSDSVAHSTLNARLMLPFSTVHTDSTTYTYRQHGLDTGQRVTANM